MALFDSPECQPGERTGKAESRICASELSVSFPTEIVEGVVETRIRESCGYDDSDTTSPYTLKGKDLIFKRVRKLSATSPF
jgi:hypothetical protein